MSEIGERTFDVPPNEAVVLGKWGRHQHSHPGNNELNTEVANRFWDYEEAGKASENGKVSKRDILEALVKSDTRIFVVYIKEKVFKEFNLQRTTDFDKVIQAVRKQFNKVRDAKREPEKWLSKQIDERSLEYHTLNDQPGQANIVTELAQTVTEMSGGQFRVYNDKTRKWTKYETIGEVCSRVKELFEKLNIDLTTKLTIDVGNNLQVDGNYDAAMLLTKQPGAEHEPGSLQQNTDAVVGDSLGTNDPLSRALDGIGLANGGTVVNGDLDDPFNYLFDGLAPDSRKQAPLSKAKQELLDRLSGEKGNRIAELLSDIMDLAEQHENPEDFYYDDATKKAFKSLASCKQDKRPKPSGDNEAAVAKARSSQDDDGHSRAQTQTPGQKSIPDTMLSGLASIIFNTEKYVSQLDIHIARQYDGGAKEYYGTMLRKPNVPHGYGFMIYNHKKKWAWGQWRKGKLHGLGGVIYENNHRCFGLFLKDKLNGKAMYLVPGKFKYIGAFRNHKKHGFGLLIDEEKGTYHGNFVNGKFEGIGIYTDLVGREMKGEFKDWKLEKPDPSLVLQPA